MVWCPAARCCNVAEDGLYTSTATFEEDSCFSPRNWLHRYRLTFMDSTGLECEVSLPIPWDLKQSLHAVPKLLEPCQHFASKKHLTEACAARSCKELTGCCLLRPCDVQAFVGTPQSRFTQSHPLMEPVRRWGALLVARIRDAEAFEAC